MLNLYLLGYMLCMCTDTTHIQLIPVGVDVMHVYTHRHTCTYSETEGKGICEQPYQRQTPPWPSSSGKAALSAGGWIAAGTYAGFLDQWAPVEQRQEWGSRACPCWKLSAVLVGVGVEGVASSARGPALGSPL